MKRSKRLFSSFQANIIASAVILLLVFSILVAIIGYVSFTKSFELEYDITTYHMAELTATLVDGNKIDEYLTGGESYHRTKRELDKYCRIMDVSVIYVIDVDTSDYNSYTSVFNCIGNNSPYTEWELGSVHETTNDEYRETYQQLYEGTLAYGTIYRETDLRGAPPHITTLVPLKDFYGNVVSVLCVQRLMQTMIEGRRPYLIIIAGSAALLMIISSVIAAMYVKKQFVSPIHKIINEARRFAAENTAGEKLGEDISHIDDISELALSIDKMEDEMLRYIDNLTAMTAEKEHIATELSLAASIQSSSLPNKFPAFPERDDFDIYASMTPAKDVGGDFYDFFLIDDDHLALVIADVSGKGIPAALFMMVTKILIKERTQMGGSPAEILTFVNNRTCQHNKEEMFITVWLGILELSTGKLLSANAGHDDPAIMRKDGNFEMNKTRHGLVIGALEGVSYRDIEMKLNRGDKIFLYTDGIPEATDKDNKMMTIEGMLDSLNQHKEKSPQEIIEGVIQDVNSFVGEAPQFDDMTTVCLELKGESAAKLVVDAVGEALDQVNDFIHYHMDQLGCSLKMLGQVDLAVEEIFVNIASYAYDDKKGQAEISFSTDGEYIVLTFRDSGIPYDPLKKPDPDTTLSAAQRKIGGLGIFLAKKLMDEMSYEYTDGFNVLTMKKKIA